MAVVEGVCCTRPFEDIGASSRRALEDDVIVLVRVEANPRLSGEHVVVSLLSFACALHRPRLLRLVSARQVLSTSLHEQAWFQ